MNKLPYLILAFLCLLVLPAWIQGETQYKVIIQTPFQPEGKLEMEYPDELKKEGVSARFVLLLHCNRKGSLIGVSVWKSHYPKLADKIINAAYKWKFKPMVNRGEPISSLAFATVIFYPEYKRSHAKFAEQANGLKVVESREYVDEDLSNILDACSDYCYKLTAYALNYVCLEKVDEKVGFVSNEYVGAGASGNPDLHLGEYQRFELHQLMLKNSKKDSYLFDYQLIRSEGKINEKRMPLGKTGVKSDDSDSVFDSRLSFHLLSILVPGQLLSHEQHSLYSYKRSNDEKVRGKTTYTIDISPNQKGSGEFQRGRVWVDKKNHRILKIELETMFMEGYEEVYKECAEHFLTPHFIMTHHYEVEKNGIMFPSHSEVRIEYSGLLKSKRALKAEIDTRYSSYKFFTVDVDHNIIKKKLEDFFSRNSKNRLTFNYPQQALPSIIFRY